MAGLAVECLLRAYTELVGGTHDEKHDLRRHAENGRFSAFMPRDQQENVRVDLGNVWTRWRNNHRYRALASLRRFLVENQLHHVDGNKTVKGDVVKYNWDVMIEAAQRLLALGIQRWAISKKKWRRS